MEYKITKKLIITISTIALIISLLFVVAKTIVAYYSNSVTIVSSAVHDLANAFCCILVIICVCLMHKSINEKEHRHNDLVQGVFSIILATILLLSVVEVQIINIEQILDKSYNNAPAYTWIEICIVVVSIIINEILFHVMIIYSRKFFYPPLSANAFHLRLSSLASICALLSIVFENYLNIAIADNIITLAIGIVLAFVVYDDFSVAIKKIQGKPFSYKKHHLKKDLFIPHKDDDYQAQEEFDAFK